MIRILTIIVSVLIGLVVLLHYGSSNLAGEPQLNEFNANCKSDLGKYCANVRRGGGRQFTCLRKNKSKISDRCGDYLSSKLSSVRSSFFSFRRNCGDDYSKFCKDSPRGEGRVVRCLWSHGSELTSSCRKQITPYKLFSY